MMATTLSTPAPQTHSRPLRHAWSDTATMVRRQFVHAARYPVWIFLVVAPVAILLLAVLYSWLAWRAMSMIAE